MTVAVSLVLFVVALVAIGLQGWAYVISLRFARPVTCWYWAACMVVSSMIAAAYLVEALIGSSLATILAIRGFATIWAIQVGWGAAILWIRKLKADHRALVRAFQLESDHASD